MLQKLFRFAIIIVLMLLIPIGWYQGVTTWGLKLKGILILTGGSLFSLGLCYKLLGSWDLIPDWLPLIGGLDDSFAWIMMLVGGVMMGGGFMLG